MDILSSPLTFHVFSCRPQKLLTTFISYFKALTILHLTRIKAVLSMTFSRRPCKGHNASEKPWCSLQLAFQQPIRHWCQAAGLRVEFATVCVLCLCMQSCEGVIDQQSGAISHISTVRFNSGHGSHYSVSADVPSASR